MVATVLIVSNVVWFTAWYCISTMLFVTRLDKKMLFLNLSLLTGNTISCGSQQPHQLAIRFVYCNFYSFSGTYPDHAQGVCLHGTTPPQIACNPQEWGKKSFPFFSEYQ